MQDTGDTRETPAIDVCKGLLKDNALLHIFDPKVSEQQIRDDLQQSKFEWDHPNYSPRRDEGTQKQIKVFSDPVAACRVRPLPPAGVVGAQAASACNAAGIAGGCFTVWLAVGMHTPGKKQAFAYGMYSYTVHLIMQLEFPSLAGPAFADAHLQIHGLSLHSDLTFDTICLLAQHTLLSSEGAFGHIICHRDACIPSIDRIQVPTPRMQTRLSCPQDSHGIVVLTEWEEFKHYDYAAIYDTMTKPAFIFDGRNVLDHDHLRTLGFIVYALGKPLDPFIQKVYS